MTFVGPFIFDMNDQEYYSHQENCSRLAAMLSKVIDRLMHYIFEGRSQNKEDWESLFKAIQQAVLIKHYLDNNTANLLTIAEDFLAQAVDWERDVEAKLK